MGLNIPPMVVGQMVWGILKKFYPVFRPALQEAVNDTESEIDDSILKGADAIFGFKPENE